MRSYGICCNPAIPVPGTYPKNPKTPIQKNLCTPMFIATLFIAAKCWKQPKCPSVDECIKKLVHLHIEYCREERKKERNKELLLSVTIWMELRILY